MSKLFFHRKKMNYRTFNIICFSTYYIYLIASKFSNKTLLLYIFISLFFTVHWLHLLNKNVSCFLHLAFMKRENKKFFFHIFFFIYPPFMFYNIIYNPKWWWKTILWIIFHFYFFLHFAIFFKVKGKGKNEKWICKEKKSFVFF